MFEVSNISWLRSSTIIIAAFKLVKKFRDHVIEFNVVGIFLHIFHSKIKKMLNEINLIPFTHIKTLI